MLVVAGHVALVAVALTTKMTVDIVRNGPPIDIDWIKEPEPPVPVQPPPPAPSPPQPVSGPSAIDRVDPIVPTEPYRPLTDPVGPTGPTDPLVGTGTDPVGPPVILPPHQPVKIGAVLRTAEADLRPPYPLDKIRSEEEATLRLRLTIDDKGRVVAVDPVGQADPSFLAAARSHLLRSWRYRPATVDGVATTTTMVISLSFRLEDA